MKLIIILLLFTSSIVAQDVTITLADLQNFRKAAADAVFWEKTAKDKDDQITAANTSATNWKGLYLSEKDRADRVQGGRIDEIKDANVDLKLVISKLETQAKADAQKIGEQNAEIISLKSSRKWYFGTGAVVGATAGFFGGRQTCGVSIPSLSARPGDAYYIRQTPLNKPLVIPPPQIAQEFLKKQ